MSAEEVMEVTEEQEQVEKQADAQPENKPEAEESPSEQATIEANPPKDEDDASRLGLKESAQNADAMAIEKEKKAGAGKKKAEPEKEKAAKPSYFIDAKEKHRVEVDILSNKDTGQIVSVSRVGLGINFEEEFPYLHSERAWFDFTTPSYNDMSSYRQRSGVYRQEAQSVIIDKLQLRNFILVWHLKDWSMTDEKGKKIKLTHEKNGALSDESMSKVYELHTTIVDVVLTVLEKDILLA